MAASGIIQRITDIGKGIKTESLGRIFSSGDGNAHTFYVSVYNNGVAQDLTGYTVQGYFIRSTEDTVLISGSASGNIATITLPAACYAEYGAFALFIRVINGTTKTTVYTGTGYVVRSSTDTIIDPGHVIPDIYELLAQIGAMEEATGEAQRATTSANTAATNVASIVAAPFIEGTGNAAGSYVTNNGELYELPDGHTANVTWENTTKTPTKVGPELNEIQGDVAALKSAIGEVPTGKTVQSQIEGIHDTIGVESLPAGITVESQIQTLNSKIGGVPSGTSAQLQINDIKSQIQGINGNIENLQDRDLEHDVKLSILSPAATAEDVGKTLVVKTVENGQATSYEFGETTEIDDTAGEGDTDKTWSADKLIQIGQGLTDAAKLALLACFAHVAWQDNNGSYYYNALESALSGVEYPKIVAISSQGSAIVYNIDTIESVRQYIAVTYYESAQAPGEVVSMYSLNGVLTPGNSKLIVSYNGLTTTVNINVTDWYNQYTWVYPSANMHVLAAEAELGNFNEIELRLNFSGNKPALRRSVVAVRGNEALQYRDMSSDEYLQYYAIPVPVRATHVSVSMTPTNQPAIFAYVKNESGIYKFKKVFSYNDDYTSVTNWELPVGTDRALWVGARRPGGAVYSDQDLTAVTITFTEGEA